MKRLTGFTCCGLLLAALSSAQAGEMIVREFPDRFEVEYDGTNDPKLPPVKYLSGAVIEELRQKNEDRNMRIRGRLEERMTKARARADENRRALEQKGME